MAVIPADLRMRLRDFHLSRVLLYLSLVLCTRLQGCPLYRPSLRLSSPSLGIPYSHSVTSRDSGLRTQRLFNVEPGKPKERSCARAIAKHARYKHHNGDSTTWLSNAL
ncbi:hypothetical protein BJY52DRAFT_1309046 [Lactarius psammicola]|nr:hypothetical protein BJY52DRAFT_1309046 [Lactarius psammicola]